VIEKTFNIAASFGDMENLAVSWRCDFFTDGKNGAVRGGQSSNIKWLFLCNFPYTLR
jgi:hypothetical protein